MFDFSKTQAIISDFDNTITTTTEVDDQVVKAVHKINQLPLLFTIATGRHGFGVMERVAEVLQLTHPIIVRGGAEILNHEENETIWQEAIDKDTLMSLSLYLEQNDIPHSLEAHDKIHSYKYQPRKDSTYYDGLSQVDKDVISKSEVVKIIVRMNEPEISTLLEHLQEEYSSLHLVKSGGPGNKHVIDVTSQKASKHLAVLEFIKLYDLNPGHIIGIGDGYNDYPLLTACGYKVATADAPDELKEIADEIIPPASENGILEILNRFK